MKLKLSSTSIVVTFILSGVLAIAGFLVPPRGVIDGSVLTAIGEFIAIAGIAQIPAAIAAGSKVKYQHNNSSIEINGDDDSD